MTTPSGAAAMVLAGAMPLAEDGSYLFPVMPGMTLTYTMRPTFDTIVQRGADRSTARIQLDPYPLWEYDLTFEYVSDDPMYTVDNGATNPARLTQLEQLVGLFCLCGGQFGTFLFDLSRATKKASDSHAQNVAIGTGDGATTVFQLVRQVGPFLDLIDNPVPSSVSVVVSTANSTGAANVVSVVNGLVTLASAPPQGAHVSASFRWLHRMRFTSDAEGFDAMWYRCYSRDKLKLVQERN